MDRYRRSVSMPPIPVHSADTVPARDGLHPLVIGTENETTIPTSNTLAKARAIDLEAPVPQTTMLHIVLPIEIVPTQIHGLPTEETMSDEMKEEKT